MLRTATVEKSTLDLLKSLQQLSLFKDLRLVGGTALALQIGHRHSIDLDFFGHIEASGLEIVSTLEEQGYNVSLEHDTKPIKMMFVNGIKIDVVNYKFPWIDVIVEDENVRMAGRKDIAAMKLSALTGRGTRKDFVDIYFLLKEFSLKQMFELYEQKYRDAPLYTVFRSLAYFVDAEEQPMPEMLIPVNWEEIKSTIQKEIERFDKETD